MFETLTDIFLTSPLNFCCIGSPPQSPHLTQRVVVSPPPPPSSQQRTSIALPGRIYIRGPYALQKTSIDDVAERPVVRPGRSMERAVITPEPPGDDEEEGEGEEGMVATQKSLVQDLKTPKEDTATVAAEVEETPEIPAAKKDVTAAAATPNRDIAAPTPNKNDVTTLSITKISHHNHRRHDSFASVKSAISFTTIRTKHKHSRQLSTESVSSVLGEEMKRGYVRAIWLLEGGGEVGGER